MGYLVQIAYRWGTDSGNGKAASKAKFKVGMQVGFCNNTSIRILTFDRRKSRKEADF
jgi:hypothetical protein